MSVPVEPLKNYSSEVSTLVVCTCLYRDASLILPLLLLFIPDQTDFLMIEDESGRMALLGLEGQTDTLVTGVVLALKGHILETGQFQVHRNIQRHAMPCHGFKAYCSLTLPLFLLF